MRLIATNHSVVRANRCSIVIHTARKVNTLPLQCLNKNGAKINTIVNVRIPVD